MSLTSLTAVLDRAMAIQAQLADWEIKGSKVKAYRSYYDGEHPANMTPEMRQLLRVGRQADGKAPEFHDNYMQVIVDTMTDRVNLDTINADNDAASAWAQDVLDYNRVDGLNGDVHTAAIRDSETFLMTSWDNEARQVIWTQELAYDGTSGILCLYRSNDSKTMEAALKIWCITADGGSIADTVRINVMYSDRIVKFIARNGLSFERFIDDSTDDNGAAAWVDKAGRPLGIPITPFRNRERHNQGLSELENAIPLQNALNRNLHSIVMASEMNGFQIRWAKGFPPPADIAPGVWVQMGSSPIEQGQTVDIGTLEVGDLSQLLATAHHLIGEIGKVTRTPAPEFAGGDNASGEALKQREIGLLGKVRRFQIKAGNAWEDAMRLAWNVQAAYGTTPPAYTRFYAKWKDAEVRNDKETIANAVAIADRIGDRQFLRIIASIYDWDDETIEKILKEKQADTSQKFATLAGNLPTYSNFQGLSNSGVGQ